MPFPNPATTFPPGVSGNPAGRPPGESLTAELRRLLRDEARLKGQPDGHGVLNRRLAAEKLFQLAMGGDAKMMKILWERADGRTAGNVDDRQEVEALKAELAELRKLCEAKDHDGNASGTPADAAGSPIPD